MAGVGRPWALPQSWFVCRPTNWSLSIIGFPPKRADLRVPKRFADLSKGRWGESVERPAVLTPDNKHSVPMWQLDNGPPCAGPARHQAAQDRPQRRLAMATPRRCSSPSRRCSIINDEHLRRCSSIFEDAHVFIEDAHESLFEHLRARRGGEGDRARRGEGGEANPKRRGVIVWAARVPSLLRRAPTTEPEGQDDILAMG